MLHSKSYSKKTKKGSVLKVVKEHYLRDDIYCGSSLAAEEHRGPDLAACKLSTTADTYLVIDTNVALHQMDFLEHASVSDVVVLSTVLEEVKKRNNAAYGRLRALCASPTKRFFVFSNENHRETYCQAAAGETPNDRNDRAIRFACAWYARIIPGVRTLMLTNDAASRALARAEGVLSMSVSEYAATRKEAPELLDLVAAAAGAEAAEAGADTAAGGADGKREPKRARIFAEHLRLSELTQGLKDGRFHQGALRVNRVNPWEGLLGSDALGADILVSGRADMNRSMDGDVVVVELLPPAQWKRHSSRLPGRGSRGGGGGGGEAPALMAGEEDDEGEEPGAEIVQVAPGEHLVDEASGPAGAASETVPTGRVVGIIKRNWRTRGYCGSLQPPASGAWPGGAARLLFVPVERKYPKIRIQTRQAAALGEKRVLVAIDEWDTSSAYPTGHYVRTLGDIGDRETETEVLIIENDIETRPFTEAVYNCVPRLPWAVPPEVLAEEDRADFRHLLVCSVDPPGCRDIDDALHARPLPNGNVEVGVHIADVTAFVGAGTPIDEEASRRATSVYLVERRIDMLPKALTEDICSLRAGVERMTFSVLWELTPQAEVVSTRFTKAVIRSSAALSYLEAQARMDDCALADPLTEALRQLNALAKQLRRQRAASGALTLASPEVKFTLDSETQDPLDVGMYQVREANQMVEEFMLLANCTVARRILDAYSQCALLRRHPVPTPRMFEPLLRAAAAAGHEVDIASSSSLGSSLDAATRADDPYFNKLIRIMATRCMTQAVYFASGELAPPDYHHYGLAAPLYTHFTSPIRRYADVVVHRLLAAAVGIAPLPEETKDLARLRDVSGNLNYRHRNAQMAGRASVELHTLIFFRNRSVVTEARVTKVRANGLIVFIPKYGIEGPVYFSGPDEVRPEGEWVLDAEAMVVRSRDGATQYRIFDAVTVRIRVEKVGKVGGRQRLAVALVGAGAPAEEVTTMVEAAGAAASAPAAEGEAGMEVKSS